MNQKFETGLTAKIVNPDGSVDREVPVVGWIPEAQDAGFVKLYSLFSQKVIQDLRGEINGATDLLLWFLAELTKVPVGSDHRIFVDPARVCADLQCSRPTFTRHIKLLKRLKYVSQPVNRQMVYILNQEFVFRGTLRQKLQSKKDQPFDTVEPKKYVLKQPVTKSKAA